MTEPTSARRGRPALDDDAIERLRDAIVDAAARAFAERGAGAATIDDIAREAGVSRATVYRYAGGRDELILAVTLRRFDEWVDGVVAHVAAFDTVADIVTEAIVWTVKTVRHDESLTSLFAGGTAVAASDVLTKRPRRSATNPWRERFGTLLRTHRDELRAGLDPDDVADHVLGVLLAELARPHRRDITELRNWIATWLLPAVLEQRPPLPPAAPAVRPRSTTAHPAPGSTQTSVA